MFKYYSLVTLMAFFCLRIFLTGLKISGTLCDFILIILICLNAFFTIKHQKSIKFKPILLVLSFISLLLATSINSLVFSISEFILMTIISMLDRRIHLKIICILLYTFLIICPYILLFPIVTIVLNDSNHIYDFYHCPNNYGIYAYSIGAMDIFHYGKEKHYKIISLNDIIEISYRTHTEISQEEYDLLIENGNCHKGVD